jgi:hypothetical protein
MTMRNCSAGWVLLFSGLACSGEQRCTAGPTELQNHSGRFTEIQFLSTIGNNERA